jgi:hypothetical protein
MLEVALEEARTGLGEGGIPIGAALFTTDGMLLGRGPQSARPRAGSLTLRRGLASTECVQLLAGFIAAHPELWHEDIGEQ